MFHTTCWSHGVKARQRHPGSGSTLPHILPGTLRSPGSQQWCPSSHGKVTQDPIDVLSGTCDCSLSDTVSCYLMRACVMSNEHTRFALSPPVQTWEDAGYCLLFLPRSYVNMHWNDFMSGYRVIFSLWNWGILWPRVYFVDYSQGIVIPPVRKSVLSWHRIPVMLVLGNSLSKSDDTACSGNSPLCWDTTEEGTLISCLYSITLVDI